MQEHSPSASQVLLDFLKILAIPIAGGIGYLFSWFRNRGKRKPELSILEASAAKTRAEAKKLDGETLDLAYERIDELVVVNFQLRKDLLDLQKKVDMAEIRDKFNDGQRRKMKAMLDVHGIKYSEFDEPKDSEDIQQG
jgi:hypothetical protein